MSLVQLFVPAEVAHDTVAELGELGNVQFKDVSYTENINFFMFNLHNVIVQAEPKCKPFPTFFCWRNS